MSNYDAIECTLCGYYYMRHLGACPNCYPEQASNTTNGEYLAIAYPQKLDSAVKPTEKAQKGAKEASSYPKDIIYRDEPSLYFVVDGEPIPKERPRVSKGKAYTPDNTKKYKELVQQSASLAMRGKIPSNRLIYLDIEFRRKNEVKADVDNLSKAIMDACNGILWQDDKQVRRLFVDVSYGWKDSACAIVRMYESAL